jgi:acetoin utilization deacetylase AcuC-like enzyme
MFPTLIAPSACSDYDPGPNHPDRPGRLEAIQDRLLATGLGDFLPEIEAAPALPESLAGIHDLGYVRDLAGRTPAAGQGPVALDADTFLVPGMWTAALHAAGAALAATDRAMARSAPVLALTRPAGHHAEPNRAMGFCLLNNAALAVERALTVHGLERVAVVDFDAHHGNGTEAAFLHDQRVWLASSYQAPLYPFPEPARHRPGLLPLPLPAGSDGAHFRQAVTEHWLGALEHFAPQLVVVSAGFDAHSADDMSDLRLGEMDYGWLAQQLGELARTQAGGRLVTVLEGGYNPPAVARSAAAFLRALLELPP